MESRITSIMMSVVKIHILLRILFTNSTSHIVHDNGMHKLELLQILFHMKIRLNKLPVERNCHLQ